MQKQTKIERERQLSLLILGISILIIVFTILHARSISNIGAYE